MSLRVTGNAIPLNLEALNRRGAWRAVAEHFEVDNTAVRLNGIVEGQPGPDATMFRIISGTGPGSFLTDGRTMWDLSTAMAQNRNICFRPFFNAVHAWGWRDVMPAMTGAANLPTLRPSAVAIEAWMRKKAAGDATHARRTFGFGNNTILTPSAGVPRCGLIGDGALGFRFGSVGCPNGAAAGETAAGAIDANFIQPAELINPGVNWFHVRIKLIPPGPNGEAGKWAGYLNGRLVGVFTQAANLPRGAGAVSALREWDGVEPTIYSFSDAAGALVGQALWGVRVSIEDDWTT